ncbi:MAG: hypothetical protein RLP14_05835 [Owenweeksia sp.]
MNKQNLLIGGVILALIAVLYFTGVFGKKDQKQQASDQEIRQAWESVLADWILEINGWAQREELGWTKEWFNHTETEKYNAAAWQVWDTEGWKNKLPKCWTVKFHGDGSKAELVKLNQFECGIRSLGL